MELPDFLLPQSSQTLPTIEIPKTPGDRRKLMTSLNDLENGNLFERVLEKISVGIPLSEILYRDGRDKDYSEFLRWILKDPQRKQRYYEAQEIGGELVAAEMLEIADAKDSLEDVQRSKLRIDTRKFLLSVWNKKRYGETKQIEINQSISITDALAAAQTRVIEGEVIYNEDAD